MIASHAHDALTSLATSLKESTSDLHVAAERHPFQRRLLQGNVSRDELSAYLHEMSHVHRALEECFDATSHPVPRSIFADHHRRSHLAKQDVRALEGPYAESARTRAARSFIGFIHDTASADPISLVGILYVLEGATNGNVYLARAIEKSLSLEPRVATSSLDPHGPDQRPRWQAFRAALDTFELTGDEPQRLIAAARASFRAVHDISDELAPARG